ncbi:MAG: hypothetical protein J5950_05815 [Clostridia bacterium]|nr:hypothetical protein [Clostridia bacterium]
MKRKLTDIKSESRCSACLCRYKMIICLIVCALSVSAVLPVTSYADTAPKPSVHVTFENLGDSRCYATLLSEKPSTGPYSVLDSENDSNSDYITKYYESAGIPEDVWRKFTDFKDSDGFYFLQLAIWSVSNTKELAWTYYPPNVFKILLYFPETGKFVESNKYERYAFDSYYTVDVNELAKSGTISAIRSYKWGKEILNLSARILITIAIELCIALLFGFRGKKAFLLLALVNAVTQIALNVLLNVIVFKSGPAAFIFWFILLELAITALEAAIYATVLRKVTESSKPVWYFIVYAIAANAASFFAGLLIAHFVPGLF